MTRKTSASRNASIVSAGTRFAFSAPNARASMSGAILRMRFKISLNSGRAFCCATSPTGTRYFELHLLFSLTVTIVTVLIMHHFKLHDNRQTRLRCCAAAMQMKRLCAPGKPAVFLMI